MIERDTISSHAPEYLHEYAQMAFEWQHGRRRARRFATRDEAWRFGLNMLPCEFEVKEHTLRDLVREDDATLITGEIEELVAF